MESKKKVNQTDLERRQSAERDLAQTQEIFRLLVDAVEDYAIFALDTQGFIITWNKGGERLKGYSAHEAIGSHFSRFYTKPDIDRNHPAHELEIAEREGKYEEEGWRIRKDGSTFWANVVITALKDAGGKLKGFAKVTRDLSERKRAEEDLREAYAGLERRVEERTRELMESKQAAEEAVKIRDRFFSMASHELKTPLSSLKLQTQIRKRKVERGIFDDFVPENLIALCENDERQIERLTFLVDNMLDVSKISAGTFKMVPEELDLCELIDDVIKRLEPILRQSGNETIWRRHEPVPGNWDRHRLEQVFTNLLINAGKYAPGKPVEVTLKNESGLVTAKVCDQGPGIEPESLLRIFSPFERLKEGGHKTGLGLGLYITRQILEAHGGTITVQSRIGEGTIFTVELRQ